jgi:hypothetical protein
MHPDDGQPIDRLVQWALRRREVYPAEYRTRRADGGYTWWEERGAPTAFRDGRPVRWVGVIRNMILSPGPALVVDSTFVAGPGDRVGTTPTARPGGAGDTTATTLANAERQHVLRACKARGWRIKRTRGRGRAPGPQREHAVLPDEEPRHHASVGAHVMLSPRAPDSSPNVLALARGDLYNATLPGPDHRHCVASASAGTELDNLLTGSDRSEHGIALGLPR